MSAAELSRHIKISQAYLSEIENDKKIPTLDVLQKIAKTLNTTVSELIGENTNSLSPELQQLINTAKTFSPEQLNLLNEFLKTLKKK